MSGSLLGGFRDPRNEDRARVTVEAPTELASYALPPLGLIAVVVAGALVAAVDIRRR